MLIPNHPHDERLAALAEHDTDATADAALTAHVASCVRCTGLIDELGALRAALADLPDVAPLRPLRLLPPAEVAPASTADRLSGWVRRFFAPALASGAALALVGTIGTAAPALNQAASGPAADSGAVGQSDGYALEAPEAASAGPAGDAAGGAPALSGPSDGVDRTTSDAVSPLSASPGEGSDAPSTLGFEDDGDAATNQDSIPAERSPWPMVLFAGVALMIGALVLRWILVPRPG